MIISADDFDVLQSLANQTKINLVANYNVTISPNRNIEKSFFIDSVKSVETGFVEVNEKCRFSDVISNLNIHIHQILVDVIRPNYAL
jgi:hypothetical protein